MAARSPCPYRVLPSETAPAVVFAERVSVGYGGSRVLAPLDLTVGPSSLVAIVGPNGAGKSTLLKLVTGALQPWSGRITLFGAAVDAARRRGAVAYMPQHEQLDWDFPFTVDDVVLSGRLAAIRQRGGFRSWLPMALQPAAERERAQTALAAVDMAGLGKRAIGALSGGQKKRVLLARALAQDAALLVLDEPLAGVDRDSEAVIHDLLVTEKQRGRTILMVTHDLDGLDGLADRVLVINGGLVADGTPADLFDARTLARARLVGAEAALRTDHAAAS